MKKGLKRFGLTVLTVLIMVGIVDYAAGNAIDAMMPHIGDQGHSGKTYYAMNEAESPLLIVGSSRAAHSYVTNILEDSLGIDGYNAGVNGCFLTHNCCVINALLQRYTPQLIIWEYSPQYIYKGVAKDPIDIIAGQYGNNEVITDIINRKVPLGERIKLTSRLYCNNTHVFGIIARYLIGLATGAVEASGKGYEPLQGVIRGTELQNINISTTEIGPYEYAVTKQTIANALSKGVRLILTESPRYLQYTGDEPARQAITSLCDSLGVPFVDYSQLPEFLSRPDYFKDRLHLNDEGAKHYTSVFAEWYAERYQ